MQRLIRSRNIGRPDLDGFRGSCIGGGAPTTSEDIIGATDASLPNAAVWPALYKHPDVPPASPNGMNDEFDGTSLDAKWTVYNPALIAGAVRTFGSRWMNHTIPNTVEARN
jgi:hypothetical protein